MMQVLYGDEDEFAYCDETFRQKMTELANKTTMIKKCILLPVTTRGIGFYCQYYLHKFAKLGLTNLGNCNVYKLYRVSLMQLESKLSLSQVFLPEEYSKLFKSCKVLPDYRAVLETVDIHLKPIKFLISTVGTFEDAKTKFIPCMPANPTVLNVEQPDPTMVYFSNLRWVVTFLSDPNSPQDARRYFYSLNALPGAQWNVGLSDPVLSNPNDFIPEGYAVKNFKDDVAAVKGMLRIVDKAYPTNKFIDKKCIDYCSHGNTPLLVSNEPESLRCAELGPTKQYTQLRDPIQGKLLRFWSLRHIPKVDFCIGTKFLLGELSYSKWRTYAFHPRSLHVANQECKINHTIITDIDGDVQRYT